MSSTISSFLPSQSFLNDNSSQVPQGDVESNPILDLLNFQEAFFQDPLTLDTGDEQVDINGVFGNTSQLQLYLLILILSSLIEALQKPVETPNEPEDLSASYGTHQGTITLQPGQKIRVDNVSSEQGGKATTIIEKKSLNGVSLGTEELPYAEGTGTTIENTYDEPIQVDIKILTDASDIRAGSRDYWLNRETAENINLGGNIYQHALRLREDSSDPQTHFIESENSWDQDWNDAVIKVTSLLPDNSNDNNIVTGE